MTVDLESAAPSGVCEREQIEAAGWIGGIAEALAVLLAREPSRRERVVSFAMNALARWVDPADWARAGLPVAGTSDRGSANRGNRLPVSHGAVLRLAHSAMSALVSEHPAADRPRYWDRLAAFMRSHVPAADRDLRRIAESSLLAHVTCGDVSLETVAGLVSVLEQHRITDGEDAYGTSTARMNLALAYQARAAGTDLAEATALTAKETARQAVRYGPAHPAAMRARDQWTSLLLALADAEPGLCARRDLARQALAEANLTRITWDRLAGVTSQAAIRSRTDAGHALLLLGELDKARLCLECALAFDVRRLGTASEHGRGRIFGLLTRVYSELGDVDQARAAGQRAVQILGREAPASSHYRQAASLLRDLHADKAGGQ